MKIKDKDGNGNCVLSSDGALSLRCFPAHRGFLHNVKVNKDMTGVISTN